MKPSAIKILAATLLLSLASSGALADLLTTNVAVDGIIRGGGALTNVSSITQTLTNGGILEVKSGSSFGTTGGARKSYFKFNVPPNINTNANMVFAFVLSASPQSQAQRTTLWGLNQTYPTLTASSLTWSNAQANDRAGISTMLTAGGLTATALVVSNVIATATAGNQNRSFTLNSGAGGWTSVYQPSDNTITFALTALADSTYTANSPIRIITNSATLTYYTIISGNPPSISSLSDITVRTGDSVGTTNNFTIGDTEDGPNALTPVAVSSDEAVLPSASIAFGGTGAARYLIITNGAVAGTVRVTVTVTDSVGNVAQSSFKVTVLQTAPTVAATHTNTPINTAITFPIVVSEPGFSPSNVTVTATSGNTTLVLNSGIVVTGAGTNRTVTVTPVSGQDGVAPIIIVSTDTNSVSGTNIYCVMVLPATNTVFADHFDYIISGITGFDSLDNDTGNFWFTRSGASGTHVKVSSGVAVLNQGVNVQSVIAPLKGGPYPPGNGTVLITKFKATWTSSPASPDSGNIIALWDETAGTGTPGLRGRFSTTNSPTGGFNVRIETGEPSAGLVVFPLDINVGETHTFWIKYDVDGAQTRLWVDPASEASTSVVNSDLHGNRTIYDVSLRQGTDTGPVLIDDLSVVITNRPVVAPVITSITVSNNTQTVSFTGGSIDPSSAFKLLHATDLAGPWSNTGVGATTITPGSFTATASDTNVVRFFRVQRY
jgi:hypothetical protein